MNLSNLTIVIITYNRYCYLNRLINFYQSFNNNVKFLILDSSSEKIVDQNLLTKLKSNNIVWKKYDSSIFFVEKIALGSQFINTEYSVLCADDDFLFPEALERAVRFLIENEDYSSCLGLNYKHHTINFLSKKMLLFRKSAIGGKEISEDSSSKRVFNYLSGRSVYYPIYAVHSTKNFQKIWQESSKIVDDWGLSEVFPSSYSLCIGKMKVLKFPYITRERNSFRWYDDKRLKIMYAAEKVEKVQNRLTEIICKYDSIEFLESDKFVRNSIDIFIKRIFLKVKNIDRLESSHHKIKSKIISLPIVGIFIGKVHAKIMANLRLFIINRAFPMQFLSRSSQRYLTDAIIRSNCDSKEVVNSRKDYA